MSYDYRQVKFILEFNIAPPPGYIDLNVTITITAQHRSYLGNPNLEVEYLINSLGQVGNGYITVKHLWL